MQTPTLLRRPILTLPKRNAAVQFVKYTPRTLKDKQDANGRTLALDGKDWRTLRAYVLSGEPCCRHCITRGITTVGTEVDHINNDPTDNRLVNLQPLCKSCHSLKTMKDMGHNVSMGCDVSGKPLDPCHHWNKLLDAVLVASEGNKSPATENTKPACSSSFNANPESVA